MCWIRSLTSASGRLRMELMRKVESAASFAGSAVDEEATLEASRLVPAFVRRFSLSAS